MKNQEILRKIIDEKESEVANIKGGYNVLKNKRARLVLELEKLNKDFAEIDIEVAKQGEWIEMNEKYIREQKAKLEEGETTAYAQGPGKVYEAASDVPFSC